METRIIGKTKNGKTVYVDTQGSHAATHIAGTPDLLELVQELVADLVPNDDDIYVDKDMGRPVGLSDLVETDETDKILYAERLNRDNYTRFVQNRKAEPTNFVTVVLRKDSAGDYELWSAWMVQQPRSFLVMTLRRPKVDHSGESMRLSGAIKQFSRAPNETIGRGTNHFLFLNVTIGR